MSGNCESCKVRRTMLLRRAGIYAVLGLAAVVVWKKVHR